MNSTYKVNVGEIEFGTKFYSIVNNKIAEWRVEGVYFQAYHRDGWNNYSSIYPGDKPDIEYRIVRWDKSRKLPTEDIAHNNNIGKVYFKSKEDLYKSMEEDE